MNRLSSAERGSLFGDELITWVRTPMLWQSCVKGLEGGVDCKMLMVGAARECGFPEAQSLYAAMANYSKMKAVPCRTLIEGMDSLFDRVPFGRGQLVPEELQKGDILLVRMHGRPQHLAGVYDPRPQGTAIHVQFGPKDWVKETSLDVLLRAYPLHIIYRWRPE